MADFNPLLDFDPEPTRTYKFWVILQAFRLGFSKISGIESSVEFEAFHEGGVNHKTISLLKPFSGERTLVMERGAASRGVVTEILTSRFTVGSRLPTDLIVAVLNPNNVLSKMYLVTGCTVKKWSVSDLDASSSEVLIERFELSYESVEDFRYGISAVDAFTKGFQVRSSKTTVEDLMKKDRLSFGRTRSGDSSDKGKTIRELMEEGNAANGLSTLSTSGTSSSKLTFK